MPPRRDYDDRADARGGFGGGGVRCAPPALAPRALAHHLYLLGSGAGGRSRAPCSRQKHPLGRMAATPLPPSSRITAPATHRFMPMVSSCVVVRRQGNSRSLNSSETATRNLFVGNIPSDVTEADVQDYFSKCVTLAPGSPDRRRSHAPSSPPVHSLSLPRPLDLVLAGRRIIGLPSARADASFPPLPRRLSFSPAFVRCHQRPASPFGLSSVRPARCRSVAASPPQR